MRTLNDPPDFEKPREDDWTPARGLRRAAIRGALATLALIALQAPVAWFFPWLVLLTLLRSVEAFFVAWILFVVVQNAAGFVGLAPSALAVAFTLAVLFSHHVIFAVAGVTTTRGAVPASVWFDPIMLATVNVIPCIALAVAVALCHRGVPGGGVLISLLRLRPFWR